MATTVKNTFNKGDILNASDVNAMGTAILELLSDKQDKISSSNKVAASNVSGLATVATSGSYNDLSNKPSIPTLPASLPANGGNADTVDGYHFAVSSSAGTNANTIYFIV